MRLPVSLRKVTGHQAAGDTIFDLEATCQVRVMRCDDPRLHIVHPPAFEVPADTAQGCFAWIGHSGTHHKSVDANSYKNSAKTECLQSINVWCWASNARTIRAGISGCQRGQRLRVLESRRIGMNQPSTTPAPARGSSQVRNIVFALTDRLIRYSPYQAAARGSLAMFAH